MALLWQYDGGAPAKVIVYLAVTALSVKGHMVPFRPAIGAQGIEFKNGRPTFKGDEIVKGFNEGNGLLFRIVDNKKKQWAYYNDTTQYEMHVKVTFGEDCDIKALGKTRLERQEGGECVATIVVQPCETEMFIEGRVNGFKVKMDALPLSNAQRQGRN